MKVLLGVALGGVLGFIGGVNSARYRFLKHENCHQNNTPNNKTTSTDSNNNENQSNPTNPIINHQSKKPFCPRERWQNKKDSSNSY